MFDDDKLLKCEVSFIADGKIQQRIFKSCGYQAIGLARFHEEGQGVKAIKILD